MSYIFIFFSSFINFALDAAPYLLLGLFIAGLVKAFVSTEILTRMLGGKGTMPVVKAALYGTPLPLCSCSVVPVSVSLRRSGVSRGATTSFLIATPENGIDSIMLSYSLLGPVFAIVRPIAGVTSAIASGLLVNYFDVDDKPQSAKSLLQTAETKSCCHEDHCHEPKAAEPTSSILSKLFLSVNYALGELLDDIKRWLLLGLILAAFINVIFPPGALAAYGHGPLAMLLMVLIGVPMYVCASGSTPIAASMLAAGVSPGTVLVFLLSGPSTNLGTIGIVKRELGSRAVMAYLFGVSFMPIALGLLLDFSLSMFPLGFNAIITTHNHSEQSGLVFSWICLLIIVFCGLRPYLMRPPQIVAKQI